MNADDPRNDPRFAPLSLTGNVAMFPDRSVMETPQSESALRRLVIAARETGWEAALRSVYASRPDMIRYTTDPSRTRLLDLLGPRPLGRVLEIGAGLGQITVAIARRAVSVDSLEVVAGQALFVDERARQNGLDNVRVACGGASCLLPYRDSSFDTVVMNLVLEWCGARGDEPAERAQGRMLGEARRVLRPGGRLLLATKNRFGAPYLLGGPDEHWGGMRFAGLLPRSAAERLAPRRPGETRGMLHSRSGLLALLSSAGFPEAREWWGLPDARYPVAYVPLDDACAVDAARRDAALFSGLPRRAAALLRAVPRSMIASLVPGLVFTAQTPGLPDGCAATDSREGRPEAIGDSGRSR